MGAIDDQRALTRPVAGEAERPRHPHDRLLEQIGEAIVVLDPCWRVTYWNAAAERCSGVAREDLLGEPLWAHFPGLQGSLFERALRDTMQRGRAREFHGWRYEGTADGSARGIYDARSYPLDTGGVVILFTEVSEREGQRRELEERVRQNDELRALARMMASISDSAALLGLLCSAATETLDGIASLVVRELPDGRGVCVASAGVARQLEGQSFPLHGSLIARVLETRAPVMLDEYASASPYFRQVVTESRIGPMILVPLVAHAELLGVLAVGRASGAAPFSRADRERLGAIVDHASLAAWKARLLERAEAANEAKATFLATVSHELRTPLTALTGYGELLADEILGPLTRPQHEVMERMRAVTHHLSAMIDELLSYSSLEAGRERARYVSVSTATIIAEAIAVVEPLAQGKGLRFSAPALDGLPRIDTDPDKARQILVNLLGNGVKFTEKGGSLSIGVEVEPTELRIAVSDTGVGIAPEHQLLLFQPFTQIDTGLTRRHGGTGLGLYISRRLAELLGGRIELTSEVGKGSIFTLVLPRGRE